MPASQKRDARPGTGSPRGGPRRHAVEGASSERWKLLGLRLRARRIELGYPVRKEFAIARGLMTDKGNPNVRMINAMELNERPGTYMPGRLEQFARVYEVTAQSVYDLLDGKTDELTPAPPALPAEPPGWAPPFAEPGRRDSARPYADRIWERLRQLAARGVMNPSGAQVFGTGTADARDWDGAGSRLPLPDRVWLLADLQRRDAGRRGSDREDHPAGA